MAKKQTAVEWLKSREILTIHKYDNPEETIDITPNIKCVKAIHTTKGSRTISYKTKNGEKKETIITWTAGSVPKSRKNQKQYLVVSENGYCISFEGKKPDSIKSKENKDNAYINLTIPGTEKLNRVIWFSFAMDAIKNNTELPLYIIGEGPNLRSNYVGPRLTKEELISLMTEEAKEHDGIKPASKGKQYEVHHKDMNPLNNRIDNLELLPWWAHQRKSEYESIHAIADKLAAEIGKSIVYAEAGVTNNSEFTAIINAISQLRYQDAAIRKLISALKEIVMVKGSDFFNEDRFVIWNAEIPNYEKIIIRIHKNAEGKIFPSIWNDLDFPVAFSMSFTIFSDGSWKEGI